MRLVFLTLARESVAEKPYRWRGGAFFLCSRGADTSLIHRHPYQPARKDAGIMGKLKKATGSCFFPLTSKLLFATVADMNKAETSKLLGVTRQHLDFVLSGKRNFSFHAARRATAVIGGTLSLWLDRDKAADRAKAWERFQRNTRRRVEK